MRKSFANPIKVILLYSKPFRIVLQIAAQRKKLYTYYSQVERDGRIPQPPGQPIGVNVHCTLHPIREQPLSQAKKLLKLTTQMKNISHASRIPSLNQSPTCHSAEWKTPLLPSPAS
ncbi:hypothetical protein TNCV_2117041 [Trichonephila clavipes]|nr:hypothetical protein TNCV_2117041 [Trichonephila clavipes]